MSTYEPLSKDNRAALAELIGDAARPAPADFLLRLGHTVKDCRTHDHGTGEDIFCGNLAGWMGERMALVMRRLLDAEAELEKYVGKEPTVAEEMQHLNRCLDAVYDLCEEAKRAAGRWENPLPVPEWVAAVEQAADGDRPLNTTPLALTWDRLVMHPNGSEDDRTIVACTTEHGRPAALFLDDEHREALGLQLVDPDGEGEAADA